MNLRDDCPTVIAYVPVLHRGYLEFFKRFYLGTLYVLSDSLVGEFPHLAKNLPALEALQVVRAINAWISSEEVALVSAEVLTRDKIAKLVGHGRHFYLPDEDVSREFAERHLPGEDVNFKSIFLRRDKQRTLAEVPVVPGFCVDSSEFCRQFMAQALTEADKTSDWFRQVGAAAVRDNELLIIAHNRHFPSPQTPYAYGDPRANFKKMVNLELSGALHAEAGVISAAARHGIALEGAKMYVTTFPCPPCAKLVANSGIKRLYFLEGYSQLDGQEILEAEGIEIVQVQ